MLFDAPAQIQKLGTVRVLRKIQVDKSNLLAVAKALGMDPKIKGMSPTTIYVVQDAPDGSSSAARSGTDEQSS
jgi:hypothetical protein